MICGARFPGRYLQGPGALGRLGSEAQKYGPAASCVIDRGVFDTLAPAVTAATDGKVALTLIRHRGQSSESEIARVVASSREAGVATVIGIGGGKALDTAKAAAHHLGARSIIVPSIAASDAPCSALAVIYTDEGKVAYDMFLQDNPDLVLVDTTIIANAPSRFLSAGIGDALATYYEAEAARRSGAGNCLGLPGVPLAYDVAGFCRDTIFEFGVAALNECDAGTAGPAMERIVEANILLSGLGFESGGVAAAHAIHHGLCEIDEAHHYLHGEKVAIGVLAELKLEKALAADYEKVRQLIADVRLPTCLADIGIIEATPEKLRIIAERACRPGEIIHNEPMPVTADMVVEVLKELI